MIYIWLNILPITAATLLGLAIGYVWLRASNLTATPATILAATLAIFWLTAILAGAVILAPPQADPWTMALGSASIIWIGFVAPVLVVTLSVHGVSKATTTSAAAYWLVTMLAQAALLRGMGLVAPPT
jgi:hypothetical protein